MKNKTLLLPGLILTLAFVVLLPGCVEKPSETSTSTTLPPGFEGGRFLMVGRCVFPYAGYTPDDIEGAIFNMDGSTWRSQFNIDTGKDPMVLAAGVERFFLAFDSYAKVLDWDGYDVSGKFTTLNAYFPVGVVQTENRFYLLLSPKSGDGGCVMQVYDLDGFKVASWDVGIDRIEYLEYSVYGIGATRFPEGDMALGGKDRLFIVWYDKSSSAVYGMIYGINGSKVRDRFLIRDGLTAGCTMHRSRYVKPNVAAGERDYLVTVGGTGRLFLYNISTGDFIAEKTSALRCVHDLTYGDGRFLIAANQSAYFYDEDGNSAGQARFGRCGDQMTTLAYGNHMFAGIAPVHMRSGNGIAISFMDSSGAHITDVLAIMFAESHGLASYG